MESSSAEHASPDNTHEQSRADALQKYRQGEFVEIDGAAEKDRPETAKVHMLAHVSGSAIGAALAGGAVLAAGLPLATVGAGAAVVGAVAGAAAGRAVSKEFVRGEAITEAMDFDQPKRDQNAISDATAKSSASQAVHNPDKAAHVYSIGQVQRHPNHVITSHGKVKQDVDS